jgi:hypothetical protein
MLTPGYKIPDLSPIDVNLFFEKWGISLGTRRVVGYQAPSSAVVRNVTSLPAKFFLVFHRHFCWRDWAENTSIHQFVPAPIARLDVVGPVVAEWRHIQNLKSQYTSLVVLIPGYKIPDLSPIDVNLFFEKWRIYIRLLGRSRRYQKPSHAAVGNVTHLCQLSSFSSSIAIFVDAIGPRIRASAIRFPPLSCDWM